MIRSPPRTVDEIARQRGLAATTIYGHLVEAIEHGEPVEAGKFFTMAEQVEMAGAFNRHGFGTLAPVYESLGGAVNYDRLRVYRALLHGKGAK